jgi:hypothetical protein
MLFEIFVISDIFCRFSEWITNLLPHFVFRTLNSANATHSIRKNGIFAQHFVQAFQL